MMPAANPIVILLPIAPHTALPADFRRHPAPCTPTLRAGADRVGHTCCLRGSDAWLIKPGIYGRVLFNPGYSRHGRC